MPTAVRSLVAALALTALAVGGGVALSGPDEDRAPVAEPPAPVLTLADLDTTSLAVSRAGFCDALTEAQVARALGGDAVEAASYENGDKVPLVADLTDVAHESGCSWTAADGTRARAWVFAPPVTEEQARRLVRSSARTDGCDRVAGAPALGRPSVAVRCVAPDGGVEVGYRGLLGDAWLSCSLAGPDDPDLAERASVWCAAVVDATS